MKQKTGPLGCESQGAEVTITTDNTGPGERPGVACILTDDDGDDGELLDASHAPR